MACGGSRTKDWYSIDVRAAIQERFDDAKVAQAASASERGVSRNLRLVINLLGLRPRHHKPKVRCFRKPKHEYAKGKRMGGKFGRLATPRQQRRQFTIALEPVGRKGEDMR